MNTPSKTIKKNFFEIADHRSSQSATEKQAHMIRMGLTSVVSDLNTIQNTFHSSAG